MTFPCFQTNEFRSGVYTDGKKIFELNVGVAISMRMSDGTRKVIPPDLTIWLGDVGDRQGQKFMPWAEKHIIMDNDKCRKILKNAFYLGTLNE